MWCRNEEGALVRRQRERVDPACGVGRRATAGPAPR
jgi:hypothetical protein